MKNALPAVMVAVIAIGQMPAAQAQDTIVWSDINCSTTKIIAPPGLRCRSTQEFAGGQGTFAGSGAGGTFRNWASFGSGNGAKLYYFIAEATGDRS